MSDKNDRMSTGITQVLWGHGTTLGIVLLFAILTKDEYTTWPIILWFWAGWIFLLQLIYVTPLLIIAKVKNQKEVLKGILVAFGITFLLSGLTCGTSLALLNSKIIVRGG